MSDTDLTNWKEKLFKLKDLPDDESEYLAQYSSIDELIADNGTCSNFSAVQQAYKEIPFIEQLLEEKDRMMEKDLDRAHDLGGKQNDSISKKGKFNKYLYQQFRELKAKYEPT